MSVILGTKETGDRQVAAIPSAVIVCNAQKARCGLRKVNFAHVLMPTLEFIGREDMPSTWGYVDLQPS